jgi:hypothetical protein
MQSVGEIDSLIYASALLYRAFEHALSNPLPSE